MEKLRELEGKEIGHLIHHVNAGHNIKRAAEEIPLLEVEATTQPITRTVLRVRLDDLNIMILFRMSKWLLFRVSQNKRTKVKC